MDREQHGEGDDHPVDQRHRTSEVSDGQRFRRDRPHLLPFRAQGVNRGAQPRAASECHRSSRRRFDAADCSHGGCPGVIVGMRRVRLRHLSRPARRRRARSGRSCRGTCGHGVHGDYPLMYAMLDAGSRRQLTEARSTPRTPRRPRPATLRVGRASARRRPGAGSVAVSARARTLLFGVLSGTRRWSPIGADGSGRVHYASTLLFPGLRPGRALHRVTVTGGTRQICWRTTARRWRRGSQPDLADPGGGRRDGRNARPDSAGPGGPVRRTRVPVECEGGHGRARADFPVRARRHGSGERCSPARACSRVLARTAGSTVRTTIDPGVEQAAISALGSSYAAMTVMDPSTGATPRRSRGSPTRDLQPPGSTMKIITADSRAAGGDRDAPARHTRTQPRPTSDGYMMANSNDEDCGGTLLNAFAVSCNSVFAPLGAQARRRAPGRRCGGVRLRPATRRFPGR